MSAKTKLTIQVTKQELDLLNRGLVAGIGDDGIECIGLSKREQEILGTVGNRLLDLAGSTWPRYYDEADRTQARQKRAAKHQEQEEAKRRKRVADGIAEIRHLIPDHKD